MGETEDTLRRCPHPQAMVELEARIAELTARVEALESKSKDKAHANQPTDL